MMTMMTNDNIIINYLQQHTTTLFCVNIHNIWNQIHFVIIQLIQ